MAAVLLSRQQGVRDRIDVGDPMKPIPFFAGLVLGLVLLAVVGSSIQNTQLATGFIRFHSNRNVETGFMPTAAELATIVDQQPKPRAYVIIGGSSVLNGVGQSADFVWSRRLQDLLGKDFAVLNFANRAGGPIDFGSVAAEMLIRQHRPVIYVADANESLYANDPRTSFYKYMLFDGWHRSYLLPWPPRDRYLRWAPFDRSETVRNVALGEWLNSFLRFNELWNYVAFNIVGLQWDKLKATWSFYPARDLPDPEPAPDLVRQRRYLENPDIPLAITEATSHRPIARMLDYAKVTEELVPPELRSLSLVVVQLQSPHYLDMQPGNREALYARALEQQEHMKQMGFREVIIPQKDFTENDYADRIHLAVEGGDKLAAAVAPVVRKMATDLGYLK
jgi:hypothetical protein